MGTRYGDITMEKQNMSRKETEKGETPKNELVFNRGETQCKKSSAQSASGLPAVQAPFAWPQPRAFKVKKVKPTLAASSYFGLAAEDKGVLFYARV